jgi:aryl-alcohol dehydrogenase-like predicted oxidoreductase
VNNLSKIGLGTVQFGIDYGVSNQQGKTSPAEVMKIFEIAAANNITMIDTASTYGNSEEVIGVCLPTNSHFNVVTKSPLFNDVSPQDGKEYLIENFQKSLQRLKLDKTYGLMIHHADDLLGPCSSGIIEGLHYLREHNLVKKIGFSFYSQEQAEKIMENFIPDIVQLPLNIFDQNFVDSGFLKQLKSNDIEIHVRSAFLQGLVFISPDNLDPYFDFAKEHICKFHDLLNKYNINSLKASLSYVLDLNEVDKVILGVCNSDQLIEIIEEIKNPLVEKIDWSVVNYTNKKLTDPSLWRLING